MFFYIDWLYIILVLPAIILSLWASANVKLTFNKYSKVMSMRGETAAQTTRRILDASGLYNVRIERVHGHLTDHFDPKTNVIRLSDATYDSTSTSAIGVGAHEAGHAIQYSVGYIPLKLRNAIIPVTNIGSRLAIPLIMLGILLSAVSATFAFIAYVGVFCFMLSTLFQLLTLPTEFNASKRALVAIEEHGILSKEESKGAKKVLSAAAMTYVAALAVSLAYLLRFLLIVSRASSRRR